MSENLNNKEFIVMIVVVSIIFIGIFIYGAKSNSIDVSFTISEFERLLYDEEYLNSRIPINYTISSFTTIGDIKQVYQNNDLKPFIITEIERWCPNSKTSSQEIFEIIDSMIFPKSGIRKHFAHGMASRILYDDDMNLVEIRNYYTLYGSQAKELLRQQILIICY